MWSFSVSNYLSTCRGLTRGLLSWPQTVTKPGGSPAYTLEQVNYYPTGITAMSIAGTVFATLCPSPVMQRVALVLQTDDLTPRDSDSDYARNRFIVNPIMAVFTLIPSVILLIWNVPTGVRFFAYYLGGIGYAGCVTLYCSLLPRTCC